MKRGLVVEGGAMRAVFNCGVMDALLEGNVEIDYFIGVSAGIANGVSYISKQKERAKDIIIGYANDKRYMGFRNLLDPRNKSYYGIDFAFNEIPEIHNKFDYQAYSEFSGEIKAVVSNLETGKAEYLDLQSDEQMSDKIIASCSLPGMFPARNIGNNLYLDGGVADPIPIQKAIDDGCEKIIVVLSREKGYRKSVEKGGKLIEYKFRKYPDFCQTLRKRPAIYNSKLSIIEKLEEEGKIKVIRPLNTQGIGRLEKDIVKLRRLYDEGYKLTMERIEELREYMSI